MIALGRVAYPAVVVHSLVHARAAMAGGRAVTLLSAPGAALSGGCLWWAALVTRAQTEHPATAVVDILDCADAPGAAMGALRAGVRRLVLDPACPAFATVAAAAATVGAAILATRSMALDLGERGASRRLEAWLAMGDPP